VPHSTSRPLEACIRAWRTRRYYPIEGVSEDIGDAHLSRGDFQAAIDAYAAIDSKDDRVNAKLGFCLAFLERFDEAGTLLTETNCGTSSAELAMLAATIAGGWSRGRLYERQDEVQAVTNSRKTTVAAIVTRALQGTQPDWLAFFAYRRLTDWFEDREEALVVAQRAVALYPCAEFVEWQVGLLRALNRADNEAFDALLKLVPDDPWPSLVGELIDSALALCRYDDASESVETLQAKLRPPQECRFDTRIALLQSYLDLRRALDADPGAAVRGHSHVAAMHSELIESGADLSIVSYAAKLRLALAVFMKDAASIRTAAESIIRINALEEWQPEHSPAEELMWLGDVGHFAEFGSAYQAPEVLAALDSGAQTRWNLLLALRDFSNEESTAAQRKLIAEYGLRYAPAWAATAVATVLLASKKLDTVAAGRALARSCHYGVRRWGRHASPLGITYPTLAPDDWNKIVDSAIREINGEAEVNLLLRDLLLKEFNQPLWIAKAFRALLQVSNFVLTLSSDHQSAMFYAALAHQELKDYRAARPLYERLLELEPNYRAAYWNLTLIFQHEGDVAGLEAMLPVLSERAAGAEKIWVDALKLAQDALPIARKRHAAANFRSFMQRELAAQPPLRSTSMDATELTLAEAASLLALLRAGDLDHSTWRVTAFGASNEPFEPTQRFRPLLGDLLRKGVVNIAVSTPDDAFVLTDDGLDYDWDGVHWQINSHALALQTQIRDLSRSEWPAHWSAHAETLSRDLATEECIAWMNYLAGQRSLDAPAESDARAVFRELLEHSSVSKCWYYIDWAVKSVNDSRTKYPIARTQIGPMILKRAQQMAQRCKENGWDTARNRIHALPRSHFSAALHDVLTGWGERAFEEPLRELAKSKWHSIRSVS